VGLILPEHVVRDIRAERQADFERGVRTGVCQQFTRELQRIDPGLELVWWPEHASAPGFIPGRYHVVWHHPTGGPGSVEPFTDELGGYREPDSGVFDMVRASDMWDDRVLADQKHVRDRALKAQEKREREEREEIAREAEERWQAVTRTQVSMNRDTPWTQNASGRRER
jgi:hypothetical protein